MLRASRGAPARQPWARLCLCTEAACSRAAAMSVSAWASAIPSMRASACARGCGRGQGGQHAGAARGGRAGWRSGGGLGAAQAAAAAAHVHPAGAAAPSSSLGPPPRAGWGAGWRHPRRSAAAPRAAPRPSAPRRAGPAASALPSSLRAGRGRCTPGLQPRSCRSGLCRQRGQALAFSGRRGSQRVLAGDAATALPLAPASDMPLGALAFARGSSLVRGNPLRVCDVSADAARPPAIATAIRQRKDRAFFSSYKGRACKRVCSPKQVGRQAQRDQRGRAPQRLLR